MTRSLLERATRSLIGFYVRQCRVVADKTVQTKPGRLLVDVSTIARHDAGTGIQRLVRAHLDRLASHPPKDMDVVLMAATRRSFYRRVSMEGTGFAISSQVVEGNAGDQFLGLDLAAHILWPHRHRLRAWKRRGVHFTFVVYDLFPLRHPEWFSPKLVRAFRRWIISVATLADDLLCISKSVANDMQAWLRDRYALTPNAVSIGLLPIDLDDWQARLTPSPNESPVGLNPLPRPFLLAVGTVEPRKAQEQLLDAFESLWREGFETGLVLAGRPGWKTEALQRRLRSHAERNNRLAWLESPSDAELGGLYRSCRGTILASHAEGLGLPLLEALGMGKAVLARDLTVYREIASPEDPLYSFPIGATVEQLAAAIRHFADDAKQTEKTNGTESA